MNNELNAASHRNAVINMFSLFKVIADEMNNMLDLPYWGPSEEREYDKLSNQRHLVVVRLRQAGMFLDSK